MILKAGNRLLRYNGTHFGYAIKDLITFGSLSGGAKWFGGVLAPNGKIYGIPRNSTQVIEINPDTQTATLFGSLSGSDKWIGGVLASNGKIYGIPYGSAQILQYYTKSIPNIADMYIPENLADLKTSKYNQYHNKL